MEQLITQVKYIEKGGPSKKGSILCTLVNEDRHRWDCKVAEMSLTEIAKFIVAFFDSTSVTAEILSFTIFKKNVSIHKSSYEHNYNHYLEKLCSQIVIE